MDREGDTLDFPGPGESNPPWVGVEEGVGGGLGWWVRAADCCDCCMRTGELWTWWMTTGEAGMTSERTVEVWGSGRAEGEPGLEAAWGGGASMGASVWTAAGGRITSGAGLAGALREESGALCWPSVEYLEKRKRRQHGFMLQKDVTSPQIET